jgi:cytochrome b561
VNRSARYTGTAIALHWIAALLILGNLAFGLYMVDLPLSPAKLRYYSWHKWVGVTVFLLSAVRLLWRLSHPAPSLAVSMPHWQRKAANASHILLYVLFFAAPLSGWLFSSAAGFPTVYLGLVQIPDLVSKNRELADALKVVHRVATGSLGSLALIHAAAAVKHHVIDRDDVLARMLPIPKSRT